MPSASVPGPKRDGASRIGWRRPPAHRRGLYLGPCTLRGLRHRKPPVDAFRHRQSFTLGGLLGYRDETNFRLARVHHADAAGGCAADLDRGSDHGPQKGLEIVKRCQLFSADAHSIVGPGQICQSLPNRRLPLLRDRHPARSLAESLHADRQGGLLRENPDHLELSLGRRVLGCEPEAQVAQGCSPQPDRHVNDAPDTSAFVAALKWILRVAAINGLPALRRTRLNVLPDIPDGARQWPVRNR